MTRKMKVAWIVVSVVAVMLVALLAAMRVVADRRHERAVALIQGLSLPKGKSSVPAAVMSATPAPEEGAARRPNARDLLPTLRQQLESDAFPAERWRDLSEMMKKNTADLGDPQTWAPYGQFLEEQSALIALLRQMAASDGGLFAIGIDPADGNVLLNRLVSVAFVLGVDAHYSAAMGDYDGYAADVLALLQFAGDTTAKPSLVFYLGQSVFARSALASFTSGPAASALPPGQVRQIQAAAQAVGARQPFVEAMAGEAQSMMDAYGYVRRGEVEAVHLQNGPDPGLLEQAFTHLYVSPFGEPWISADEVTTAERFTTLVELAALPYYEARQPLHEFYEQQNNLPVTRPVTRVLMPGIMSSFQDEAAFEATADLIRIGLAVEQHQLETGVLPESLQDIEGRLGGEVPVDPFTGEEYVYQPAGGSFQLYSAGSGGADNGGEPYGTDIVWRGQAPPELIPFRLAVTGEAGEQ